MQMVLTVKYLTDEEFVHQIVKVVSKAFTHGMTGKTTKLVGMAN